MCASAAPHWRSLAPDRAWSLPEPDGHEDDIHPIRALLLVDELHGSEDVFERAHFDFGVALSIVRSSNGGIQVGLAEVEREESVFFRLDSKTFGLDRIGIKLHMVLAK